MTTITNGTIAFDTDELAWFVENYGNTAWIAYFAGIDEITTHDRQYPGNGDNPEADPCGEPFTETTIRACLAEFDGRFGPGSPMDRELPGDPGYAVALHYGVPAFGSHAHIYPINPPGNCVCGHALAQTEEPLEASE